VAPQDVVRLDADRGLGDVGCHVRVAVPVAADPRAEAQEGRSDRRLEVAVAAALGGGRSSRVLDRPVDPGDEPIQRLVEDDHGRANLVERAGRAAPDLGGLPQHRDLLAQAPSELTIRRGRQAWIVRLLEQPRDPAQPEQDRPASRLGGMGGEDERHGQPPEDRVDVLAARRRPERFPDGPTLRCAPSCSGASRPHADALAALRQVDELEVQAEGPDDRLERGPVERPDIELDTSLSAAAARADGPLPRPLDDLVRPGTRLLDDDLPQEGTQQTDLALEHAARPRRSDRPRLRPGRIAARHVGRTCGGRGIRWRTRAGGAGGGFYGRAGNGVAGTDLYRRTAAGNAGGGLDRARSVAHRAHRRSLPQSKVDCGRGPPRRPVPNADAWVVGRNQRGTRAAADTPRTQWHWSHRCPSIPERRMTTAGPPAT
jgi:hypothetical protein